ncbi:MAG TPA: hypothetical protein VIK11_08520 [Tepidiformaceae bacterium]
MGPHEQVLEGDGHRRYLVLLAFEEIAGTSNGVIYDLPTTLRPERIPGSIYVRGSSAWRDYLDAREQVDTGDPAILFSLRILENEERQLAVDWGTTYANSFFLIEPHDPACDLSDPANAWARRMNEAITATLAVMPPQESITEGWTRTTPLGVFLREVFGTWLYWSAPPPNGAILPVPLDLRSSEDTLWGRLLAELNDRFPQPAFDRAIARLHAREDELFGGPVVRARSVFRTRLGMPILRDPRCADHALRRLANQGEMSIIATSLPGIPVYGHGSPVPDEITDEEFSQFLMA